MMMIYNKNSKQPATPQIPILHSPSHNDEDDDNNRAHTSPRAGENSDDDKAPDYDGPATPAFLCKQTGKEAALQNSSQ